MAALQPVKQKGEELVLGKVQARLAQLDLDIELLGHQPEAVGPRQAATADRIGDARQMLGHSVRQLGQGFQEQQGVGQHAKQQIARAVGERVQPLANRRAGWAGFRELAHQALPAQAGQEIQGHNTLEQSQDVMAEGMQKIGQQAMRPATRLAAEPLNLDAVLMVGQTGPTEVNAPANQRAGSLAVEVRAPVWDWEGTAREGNGGGILFDGTDKMQYNDHVVGDTSPAWSACKRVPRWEVSSFLQRLPAIIAGPRGSVNPGTAYGLAAASTHLSINPAASPCLQNARRGPIILFGQEGACFDQKAWPVTLCFVVGLVSLTLYLRFSWGIWVRNLRFKVPPSSVPHYLLKTALALFMVCVSVYAALLVYDWRFIAWFWAFWGVTIFVLLFAVGNLWWEIYWGRRFHRRHRERILKIRQEKECASQNEAGSNPRNDARPER